MKGVSGGKLIWQPMGRVVPPIEKLCSGYEVINWDTGCGGDFDGQSASVADREAELSTLSTQPASTYELAERDA